MAQGRQLIIICMSLSVFWTSCAAIGNIFSLSERSKSPRSLNNGEERGYRRKREVDGFKLFKGDGRDRIGAVNGGGARSCQIIKTWSSSKDLNQQLYSHCLYFKANNKQFILAFVSFIFNNFSDLM